MTGLLSKYPLVIEIPVAWGEMDAFQHVNNIIYFRYFESARIAYFKAVGYTRLMKTSGVGPILAETRCRYRFPLTFPDTVQVGAGISEIGTDRFRMTYAVASRTHKKLAAEGDGIIVSYDYESREKVPLPALLVERIREFEPRPPGPFRPQKASPAIE